MLTYLPFCTCLSVQSAHTNVHILAQSDENNVADAVSAIVKFKSVSNHECQSYRFFRGSDLRIEAVQSFGRNIQECSQRCSPSLLQ